jgi:hypothetical protein
MLKEEWRLHKSLIGPMGSTLFPIFFFISSAFLAALVPMLLTNLSHSTFLLMFHVASAMYGLFVGSIGHIGEEIWSRRLGQINFILQMTETLPLPFSKLMAMFYIKDALFYILYTYFPLTCGIAVATPITGISIGSVAKLGLTLVLTFMTGMSLSFLISALANRSRSALIFMLGSMTCLILLVWPLHILEPGQLLQPLGYWSNPNPLFLVSSMVLISIFSVGAVMIIRERFETVHGRYRSALLDMEERFSFTGELRTLVAKEWVELGRSGVLKQVTAGLAAAILGVNLIVWLIETGIGISLPFNTVSYSGFVGLMGVLTYSWITNMEHNESLNPLPVDVGDIIKAKFVLHLILTAGISASCVVLIAVARNETSLTLLSLLVAVANAVYTGAITAHLTGLWTNTMFFDVGVILRFAVSVIPPLLVTELLSLWIWYLDNTATYGISAVAIIQLGAAIPILKGLKRRWRGVPFAFVIQNQRART